MQQELGACRGDVTTDAQCPQHRSAVCPLSGLKLMFFIALEKMAVVLSS